jgi:hypothetical protein
MLDILVAKVMLQRAGIVPIVGELIAAGVTQHVRMNAKWHFGGLSETLDKPMEADWADRSAALGDEYGRSPIDGGIVPQMLWSARSLI